MFKQQYQQKTIKKSFTVAKQSCFYEPITLKNERKDKAKIPKTDLKSVTEKLQKPIFNGEFDEVLRCGQA